MEEEERFEEKTEEPSAKRIEEFRNRGEVAVSKDLNSIIILSGCFLILFLTISYVYHEFEIFFSWLAQFGLEKNLQGANFKILVNKTARLFLKVTGPVLGVSFVLSFCSTIFQTGFLFSPDVLSIKMERLNPISGIKRLFSFRSVMEAIKGILKFSLVLFIGYLFAKKRNNSNHWIFTL